MSFTELGNLKTNEWEQLASVADRFEQAWRTEAAVDLEQYLPPPESPLRGVILQELIKTDMEIRWRRGQRLGLEHYLERFPELGTARTLAPQLICEEYHVRQLYGDRPPLTIYRQRFPDQFPEMQRAIQEQGVPSCPPAPTAARSERPPLGVAEIRNGMLNLDAGYNLIDRIGSGGFGEVWRAEAPGGIEVAIKVIYRPVDEEEGHRELEALQLIKRLRHPFLLPLQSFQVFPDRLLIVMELADGNLRDRLRECHNANLPGIPLPELLKYFRESAEALDYLHSQHVQHRDVKPDNILLLGRHAKLADFGLARMLQSQRLVSVSGSGTPGYMAPEVWRGKACANSDQYSLAVAYTELRLHRALFAGNKWMDIMFGHLAQTPDLTPLGDAEQQVLLRALSKEPDQRFPSCLAFMEALTEAVAPELARQEHQAATISFVSIQNAVAEQELDLEATVPVVQVRKRRPVLAAASLLAVCALLGAAGSLAWYLQADQVAFALLGGGDKPLPSIADVTYVQHTGTKENGSPSTPANPGQQPVVVSSAPAVKAPEPADSPDKGTSPATADAANAKDERTEPAPVEPKELAPKATEPPQQEPAQDTAVVQAAPAEKDKEGKDPPVPAHVGSAEGDKKETPDQGTPPASEEDQAEPESAENLNQRGSELLDEGDLDGAIAALKKATQLDPKSALAFKNLGDAWALKKDYDKALANAEKAIKLDDKLAKAFALRGWLHKQKRDYDKALTDFNTALRLEPKNGLYHAHRGAIHQLKGNANLAFADLSAAIGLGQRNSFTYSRRGIIHVQERKFDQAINDFTAALQSQPSAFAHNSRGQVYLAKRDVDQAISDFSDAIKSDPTFARAFFNRGLAFQLKGDQTRANADFQEAARLDPRFGKRSE